MNPREEQMDWVKEFLGAVTLCDPHGVILEMNDHSAAQFAKDGGRDLIGTNLLDCHPEPSRGKLESLMKERRANVYTIERHGRKKLVYQSPWWINGEYAGFVELVLEIPAEMPHFVRA
jgi:hypothetical protein